MRRMRALLAMDERRVLVSKCGGHKEAATTLRQFSNALARTAGGGMHQANLSEAYLSEAYLSEEGIGITGTGTVVAFNLLAPASRPPIAERQCRASEQEPE